MPANPPPAQLLPVVPADRDRAADLHLAVFGDHSPFDHRCAEAIKAGLNDHWPMVQMLAAHRLAHPPELGELASLVEALRQYRNDLLYPPAADSVQRRLAMIESLIAQVQQVTSNQERKS